NGDGAADMVYISPKNEIRVLMATAARTCANFAAGTIPDGFVARAHADFTGNGRGDVLLRNTISGQMAIITLNATGLVLPDFTGKPDDVDAACTPTVTPIPSALINLPASDPSWELYATGDFNGDGIFDIVWLRPDGTLALWLMSPNGTPPTVVTNAGSAPVGVTEFAVFQGVTNGLTSAITSFSRIQAKIFTPSCNSCHSAGNPFAVQSGMILNGSAAYRSLFNGAVKDAAAIARGMKQVVPRDPDNSFLYQKLLLWDPSKLQHFGSPMPLGTTSLSIGQLEFIKRWIEAGASETGDSIYPALLDDKMLPSYAPFVALTPPAKGYQLVIEPFAVRPNFERELFVLRELKNTAPIYITRVETRMRTNSHHFLLYTFQSNTPTAIMPAPDLVRDIRNPDNTLNFLNALPMGYHVFLGGSMTPEGGYSFPPGIALQLSANAKIDLNAHYVNKGTTDIIGEAFANLHTADASQVTQIASTLNLSNTSIPLPAMQRTTHSKSFVFSATTTVLMLTSHMHKLGERFIIRIKGGTRDGQIIYDNSDWEHPAIITFDTPIVLQAGQGLTSEITYNNTTNNNVNFGLTSEDEMGIIFGYYY
ncbi:MAG: VCBS repeat-containing protein, partial [Pseudomonadota bacterium]